MSLERFALEPQQLVQVRAGAAELERAMTGEVALAVARRWAFARSLERSATAAGVSLALLSPAVARANAEADQHARAWAAMLAGLRTGALVLLPWSQRTEAGLGPVHYGVARAGALGVWQLVPALIVGAAAALASAGWLLSNAWLSARAVQAEADKIRAQTAAAVSGAITEAAKTSPAAAAQLAQALDQANRAAAGAQPSILNSLAGAVDATAFTVRESGPWLVLAGLYLLGRRRGK